MEWNGEELSFASILISLAAFTVPFWKKALKLMGDIFLLRLNRRKQELEEEPAERGAVTYLDLREAVRLWEEESEESLFNDDTYKK